MPALSAADRIREFLREPGAAASRADAPAEAHENESSSPSPAEAKPFANDKYENMEAFQQRQMSSQMLCLEVQTKTNLISQQFQTLSSIEAKKGEIAQAIASKIAR